MADYLGALTSAEQMKNNYEKYRNKYKDSNEELVNSETFLNLMVAEMTNQDPLEPTSNTEFVAQLAQFTQLTYAKDSSQFAMSNYAATLVGKVATGSKMDGTELVTRTGVVESVTQVKNSYMVRIDGVDFDIKKITAVKDRDSAGLEGVASGSLANSIANAASMVGMYVTVDLGRDETTGAAATKTGFVDSIKVKDGKIIAAVTDAYGEWTIETPLEKITEATVAVFGDDPDAASNALSDKIINASRMVGMYVTVNVGKDGETENIETKTGFIDSIKVKDGKITAVVIDANGEWTIETTLDKITEATVATIVEEPDDGNKTDGGSKADDGGNGGEGVTGVDGGENNGGDGSKETESSEGA